MIVALVVGFIVFNENRVKSAPVAQPDVPAEWISGRTLGSPDAPVVVRLFEDFLCPTCQTFSTTVKPTLIEQYVKPGTVRLEYNYFPLQQHDPGATMTALATECAVDQGYFWPYHDKVFQMATVDQQAAVQFDDLVGYAQGMGLNGDQFRACLSSQQHKDIVAAGLSEASQLNLPGTPSIIVNGQMVGDSSLATVKAAIDAAVAAAQ
ncbi:MAG: thioredoxin domain-containing protein [Anaerolineales bacterium]|nr:thioredoxin domain-containing protein [Anaerolineales bacterium]